MKLSTYAKKHGIHYKTAWRWWKSGFLSGTQLPNGSVVLDEEGPPLPSIKGQDMVCIYARVSSSENKDNLDSQAERLTQYAIARGYQIHKVIKEVGSGVNDNRRKLLDILKDPDYGKLIVEHKDRLTRFGFNYIDTLFQCLGKEIEVVNHSDNGKDDLMEDFVSIITSFCARLYGMRRSRRKTEKLIKELSNDSKP